MRLKKRIKQSKSARKQSSVVQWGENDTNDDETDDNESLNQEEEASINNNDTADASINNEEDDNNMDIADSDDGSYLEQDIKCTQSSSSTESVTSNSRPIINSNDTCINSRASTLPCKANPKALSKSQRSNRNRKIKNAHEQLKKKEFYEVLESAAFQNAIEGELPFAFSPPVRQPPKPKSTRTPKVKEPLPWCPPERLLHRPRNISKSSEPRNPKPKKIRLPAVDYVVVPNSANDVKVNNNFPSYRIDDEDDDEDEDEDDDYDDYYDGVAEIRTKSPTNSMLPHEIAATHSIKVPIIAGKRQCTASMRRDKREKQKVYRNNNKAVQIEINSALERASERKKDYKEKEMKRKKKRDYRIKQKRDCIKPYVSCLQCEWNHECQWGCGYVHLNRATKHMKSNCCYNGLLSPIGDSPLFLKYGNLKPMSLGMQDLMINSIEHMGPLSSTYGNVLSLAAIGVENGNKATGVINTHVGGFECRGHGAPDCVTMYGRTFHYLTMARDLASGIGNYY